MKGKILLGFLVVCVSAGFWACSEDAPSIAGVDIGLNEQPTNPSIPSPAPTSSASVPSYVTSSNTTPTTISSSTDPTIVSSASLPPVSSASDPVVSSSSENQSQGGSGFAITEPNKTVDISAGSNTTITMGGTNTAGCQFFCKQVEGKATKITIGGKNFTCENNCYHMDMNSVVEVSSCTETLSFSTDSDVTCGANWW